MKAILNIILGATVVLLVSITSNAQEKQYKARLSVDYVHVIGETPFIEVATKFKGENGYEPCKDLTLNVFHKIVEDSVVQVGTVKTNTEGIAHFALIENLVPDTLLHIYVVKIEDSKKYKNAKKEVSFLDANLSAEIVVVDSVNSIKAILTDGLENPIEGVKLKINIQRLFAPLAIGRSFKTDGNGEIIVPIEESFSGANGELLFEVFMDSKKYGVIRYQLKSSIGEPITDLSTYDQRTMWSPPGKTPMFLLIFPNLLLAGIWFVIILLARNMYKIYKC